MSPKRSIVIITILGVILSFGTCIYFVGGVSAVNPPIRIYDCSGSVFHLFKNFMSFTKTHQNIKFAVTDRVGNQNDEFGYYTKFLIKDRMNDLEYQLKFEDISNNKVRIGLLFAFDWKRKRGGYGIKDVGIPTLLRIFSKEILKPLEKEQNVKMELNTSFWDNFSIY